MNLMKAQLIAPEPDAMPQEGTKALLGRWEVRFPQLDVAEMMQENIILQEIAFQDAPAIPLMMPVVIK